MITEDYVSFEVAKLLKEKGFDWECFFCWDNVTETNRISSLMICSNKELVEHYYAMPTLQMAMKWLRKVHNIAISVYVFNRDLPVEKDNITYTIDIATADMSSKEGHLRLVGPYEQAAEAAIKYCLENLI